MRMGALLARLRAHIIEKNDLHQPLEMNSNTAAMPNVPLASPLYLGHMLAVPERNLQTIDSIEVFLEQLNQQMPAAQRSIRKGLGAGMAGGLRVANVAALDPTSVGELHFLVEAQSSFAMDVRTRDQACAPSALSVCVVLRGGLHLRLGRGEFVAQAGQGLIVDPTDVELVQVLEGTHFLEFNLPKAQMLRLGAELHPATLSAAPRFAARVGKGLSRRLMFMALQAAASLQTAGRGAQQIGLFRRWVELIALTLLNEQPIEHAVVRNHRSRVDRVQPASLRRALDYIDVHAHQDLLLADIAAAACVSTSSLLRLFKNQLDQTPGVLLRQVRLDKAHAELRRGDCPSIRELALRWGFQNPSKFAQAYQRRFGEQPSVTRGSRSNYT